VSGGIVQAMLQIGELPDPGQAVLGTAGPAPVRPPCSVRRTSTIDMTLPYGFGSQLRLDGTARDAVTGNDATRPPDVVAEASTSVGIGNARTIEDITAEPTHPGLAALLGCRGGGHLRSALDEALPRERQAGTPLYLLLDDVSGCSLIAGFMATRWPQTATTQVDPSRFPNMEGVCIGFAPGSKALSEIPKQRVQQVVPLVNPDDPWGWHQLTELPPVSMRRARRIDILRDDVNDLVVIDSAFQDSAGDPRLGRIAVHEYRLRATADLKTLTLRSLHPEPRVLPYRECPSAANTAAAVVGVPLQDLRTVVLERLAKTNGCTHLNDALRALAEIPVLLKHLG